MLAIIIHEAMTTGADEEGTQQAVATSRDAVYLHGAEDFLIQGTLRVAGPDMCILINRADRSATKMVLCLGSLKHSTHPMGHTAHTLTAIHSCRCPLDYLRISVDHKDLYHINILCSPRYLNSSPILPNILQTSTTVHSSLMETRRRMVRQCHLLHSTQRIIPAIASIISQLDTITQGLHPSSNLHTTSHTMTHLLPRAKNNRNSSTATTGQSCLGRVPPS